MQRLGKQSDLETASRPPAMSSGTDLRHEKVISTRMQGFQIDASGTNLALPPCLYFAARTGDFGRSWVRDFCQCSEPLKAITRALNLMRLRQLDSGYASLLKARQGIERLPPIPNSMRSVLERYFCGVSAYHSYCFDDFDDAEQKLTESDNWVVEAVSECDCLLLLAMDSQEFCYYHARIAHKRSNPEDVRKWIEIAEAMACNRQPLLTTRAGRPVWFSTFDTFFQLLGPLDAHEYAISKEFVDPNARMAFLEDFRRRLAGSAAAPSVQEQRAISTL